MSDNEGSRGLDSIGYETDLDDESFGELLRLCRAKGVGDAQRREISQLALAEGIGRGEAMVRQYEQNQTQPPEAVFWGHQRPRQTERERAGIVPFFTRETPDPDEAECLQALKNAYSKWPNIHEGGDLPEGVRSSPVRSLPWYAAGATLALTLVGILSLTLITPFKFSLWPTNMANSDLPQRVLASYGDDQCLYWAELVRDHDGSASKIVYDFRPNDALVARKIYLPGNPDLKNGSLVAARVPDSVNSAWAVGSIIRVSQNGAYWINVPERMRCLDHLVTNGFEAPEVDLVSIEDIQK